MNSWKVILATMVIFGTGVITGGLLVKNTSTGTPRRSSVFNRTNMPTVAVSPQQLMRLEFLRSVRKDLDLTPEQHERIEKIIHEGQERSRKLWDSVAPEMRKELQSVNEKIRAELSPEQRRRFEQLLKNAPRPNYPDGNPQGRERLKGNQSDGQNNPGRPRREKVPENPAPVAPTPPVVEPSPEKN